jgi:YHS domain-containing protein
MARVLLWAILIFFILRAVSRLLQGVLEGAGYRRDTPQPRSVALVKDPVCGVFVVPGKALTSGTGPKTRYFCSEKCRRQWDAR